MRFAFIVDPLAAFQIDADTSFAFMEAAQARGHELFVCDLDDLAAEDDRAFASLSPAQVRRVHGDHYTMGEPSYRALDEMDAVFMRKDPPFDVPYLHACHLLELAERRGSVVINRPQALRAANEHLFALQFPSVIPRTLVSRDLDRVRAFIDELGGRGVVKPIDGHGGEGIVVAESGDRNLNAMLEYASHNGREAIIVQTYLPQARDGDKRVLLLNGEPLGAILRVPREDEHRGNIHVGGRVEKTTLTARDLEICRIVGPRLAEIGLWFVGLDIIGEQLTEINVTSPTGIQEMSRLDGREGAAEVIAFVEELAAGAASSR